MTVFFIPTDRYDEVIEVWEKSVLHSNQFYTPDHVAFLKPKIRECLYGVSLFGVGEGQLDGFIGIKDGKVEKLYVRPEKMGCGIGSRLLQYAIDHFNVTSIDVNEKNNNAIRLYEKFGFKTEGFMHFSYKEAQHTIHQMKR
jgi:putative acetyltransferase